MFFYIFIKKLGNGHFGTVYKAKYQGKFIAVKKIEVYGAIEYYDNYEIS